ncbi:MAG TPA: glucans biosynthesis glucosyltransferase MdoH [Hyphomicrobiales bacterium]|nr:glucans biosynthesis glucosyltransferase MdoH [Hyphomicrobiales bacterium]
MAVSLDSLKHASTPAPAPLQMLPQDLKKAPPRSLKPASLRTVAARLITFGGALALTAYAAQQMYLIVSPDQATALQWLMLVLFVITFGWIAVGACSAVAGMCCGGDRVRLRPDAALHSRTVLLMPVYNEDPARTFAALYAMGRELSAQGLGSHVELFVISDTTDPAVWIRETTAWHALREALAGRVKVWYRRRPLNRAKKAGNVQDFITRWGARYDYMVVLDADSLMSASVLRTLIAEMQDDAQCGILQTLPHLCGGQTLFARMQQFAGAVYGPIVARGITAWQGDDGNYWGHNAIIRIRAFASAAGLPQLPGRKPFGGEIMSHDFVEAALMRRAGWSVRMAPELVGSWEESPPTLLDMAVRDRRWAQGNMQHLAVVGTKGLRWPNRVHMLIGVMSYLSSPLWLALIMTGVVLTTQIATVEHDYFSQTFQLFPDWPLFDAERMITLFMFTMGVLLVPKVLGLIRACFDPALRHAGGPLRLAGGALLETALSVLYAPVCMMIHTQHVWDILRGKDSGWEAQQRGEQALQWRPLIRQHWPHMALGVGLTVGLYWAAPPLLAWMSPTLIGLVLAIALSALSGSVACGLWLRRVGLLRIEEECSEPELFRLRELFAQGLGDALAQVDLVSFLGDHGALMRHCHTLHTPPPVPQRGKPDLVRVATGLKISEAASLDELSVWLTRQETLALLGDPLLMASLASVGTSEPPPRTLRLIA